MKQQEIKKIKKGDRILCKPIHYFGGNSRRWRKVTEVDEQMKSGSYCGVAVNAHGYSEFWLKADEIFDHEPV